MDRYLWPPRKMQRDKFMQDAIDKTRARIVAVFADEPKRQRLRGKGD